jgi:hypothetical protein
MRVRGAAHDCTLLSLSQRGRARMSDLYRSALQARIAKLPDLGTLGIDDDDEEEEETDGLGELPSGMGPPAMSAPCRPPPHVFEC